MALDEQGIGITLQCIEGEEWPSTSLSSSVILGRPISTKSIIFTCPAGHCFTLEDAIKHKIFTQGVADKILEYARR